MTKITTTCSAGNWRTEFDEDGETQAIDLPLTDALYVWGLDGMVKTKVAEAKQLIAELTGSASLTVEA